MIYILYSDDYEVYLGGNYIQENEVLIDTTECLLSACRDEGIPITLFCDLPCLWRYRELGHNEFPDLVDLQMKRAIELGNDVQIHIHPHWFQTKIVVGDEKSTQYEFDLSKFLLGNWFPEGGTELRSFCAELFERAKVYLENLLCPVRHSYHCIAFRAGGYGLQPHPEEIFGALRDVGILIDSSIVPGMVLNTNVNRIDFSMVPRKGNYFISTEYGLEKDASHGIFEIPLLALRKGDARLPFAVYLFRRILKYPIKRLSLQNSSSADQPIGYPIQSRDLIPKKSTIYSRISDLVGAVNLGIFHLELGQDVKLMVDCTRHYIDRYGNDARDLYFSFSCHSKGITPKELDELKRYHNHLTKLYGHRLQAITFQDAAHKLGFI